MHRDVRGHRSTIRVHSVAIALFTGAFVQAGEPLVIKLWPGKPPGETKEIGPEIDVPTKPGQPDFKLITNVSEPTITVFHPSQDKAKGAAVLVVPGGGYNLLAIEHEGTDVCRWLNELGATAVLLKYRVPRREHQQPDNLAARQDAQRAMRILRSRATELRIAAKQIGMLGFSAGGHLTVCTLQAEKLSYEAEDDADQANHKPDFAVLIYPAYLSENGALKSESAPTPNNPPVFMAGSADDNVCNEGMPLYFLALHRAKVTTEMHLYGTGGHGYGMLKNSDPSSTWPSRCADWMKSRGILEN